MREEDEENGIAVPGPWTSFPPEPSAAGVLSAEIPDAGALNVFRPAAPSVPAIFAPVEQAPSVPASFAPVEPTPAEVRTEIDGLKQQVLSLESALQQAAVRHEELATERRSREAVEAQLAEALSGKAKANVQAHAAALAEYV